MSLTHMLSEIFAVVLDRYMNYINNLYHMIIATCVDYITRTESAFGTSYWGNFNINEWLSLFCRDNSAILDNVTRWAVYISEIIFRLKFTCLRLYLFTSSFDDFTFRSYNVVELSSMKIFLFVNIIWKIFCFSEMRHYILPNQKWWVKIDFCLSSYALIESILTEYQISLIQFL